VAADLSHAGARELIPPHVLERVPGCEGGQPPIAVARSSGGSVNTTWRVVTSAGRFVVRLHGEDPAALGIDRTREARLHAAAARADLAPALVYADPGGAFLITELLEGRPWKPGDFADPACLTRIAGTLKVLHSLPPPAVPRFDPAAILRRHVERIVQAEPSAAAELEALLARALAVLNALEGEGRTPCIVHNDLHHSNVIGWERPRLIDWEYAGVADPLFDLACVHAYYPQSARFDRLLLEETGLARAATPESLRLAGWLFVLLAYLWHRSRRISGAAGSGDLEAERELRERL